MGWDANAEKILSFLYLRRQLPRPEGPHHTLRGIFAEGHPSLQMDPLHLSSRRVTGRPLTSCFAEAQLRSGYSSFPLQGYVPCRSFFLKRFFRSRVSIQRSRDPAFLREQPLYRLSYDVRATRKRYYPLYHVAMAQTATNKTVTSPPTLLPPPPPPSFLTPKVRIAIKEGPCGARFAEPDDGSRKKGLQMAFHLRIWRCFKEDGGR